jgi:hypothetical protein
MEESVLIKYDNIKLNVEDYKLLLNGSWNENIEINMSKYAEDKNNNKSK